MIQRSTTEQRLSGAVVHGGCLVRLAGQAADGPGLDAEGRTAGILRRIDDELQQAGRRRHLAATAMRPDIRDAPAMDRAWLDPAAEPARTTIGAALVNSAWRSKINAVAALAGPGARRA